MTDKRGWLERCCDEFFVVAMVISIDQSAMLLAGVGPSAVSLSTVLLIGSAAIILSAIEQTRRERR